MTYEFSERSLDRMNGIDNQLQMIMRESIKVSPIDFGIPGHGGRRTDQAQNELFLKGVSKCDGFNDRSKHQDGLAVDFYAYVNDNASWDHTHLGLVAGTIMAVANQLYREGLINIKLKWGGTFGSNEFKGWDMGHIEIV